MSSIIFFRFKSSHSSDSNPHIPPANFLNYGPKPILVDEWQHVSFIWDQVKYEVDKTGEFGQFMPEMFL